MKSETLAWFIVGAIVILFFIGRKKKQVAGAMCGYPAQGPSATAGDNIPCSGETIAAGTPEVAPLPPRVLPTTICHPIISRFPIDRFPVVPITKTPVYPVRSFPYTASTGMQTCSPGTTYHHAIIL